MSGWCRKKHCQQNKMKLAWASEVAHATTMGMVLYHTIPYFSLALSREVLYNTYVREEVPGGVTLWTQKVIWNTKINIKAHDCIQCNWRELTIENLPPSIHLTILSYLLVELGSVSSLKQQSRRRESSSSSTVVQVFLRLSNNQSQWNWAWPPRRYCLRLYRPHHLWFV